MGLFFVWWGGLMRGIKNTSATLCLKMQGGCRTLQYSSILISKFLGLTGISPFAQLGGDLEISMADVLSFFTGAEHIPHLGFDDATLNFNHENLFQRLQRVD